MAVMMRLTTIDMVLQLYCLRIVVPQARPSGQVCSGHQPSSLLRVPSLVCRNVDAYVPFGDLVDWYKAS